MDSAPASRKPATFWLRILLVLIALALIAGFFASGLHRYVGWDYLRENLDQLQDCVNTHLPLAILIFFLIYVAVTALSLPVATSLSLVAGAVFGRWLGTGVVLVAATAGATLAFLSSRFVLRDFVERRFGQRLEAVQRGVERDGAVYLLTLRLVPLFPFFLINLGMGLTRIRASTFALVSMVGMLPGTFLYVNAGAELGQIAKPSDVLSPTLLLSFTLLGLLPLLLKFVLRRAGLIRAEPRKEQS